jgi:hypothetical protein
MVPEKLKWREKYPYGLSASQFGMALGHCGRVSDFVHYIRHIVGTEQEFKGNPATAHGIRTESMARCCYETLLGTRVHDGGFFSSPDGLLGASPDGISFFESAEGDRKITSMRLLEIKCPYRSLYDGSKDSYKPFGIPLQYMCQMQGQMALSGAVECDFFVFLAGPPETQVVAWRVFFSETFWGWCQPKLLQVVQWLREGPPLDGSLDRSFSFEPFDYSDIDVRPLVFPWSITGRTAIVDSRRFPFFFLEKNRVLWERRNKNSVSVRQVKCESDVQLQHTLVTFFDSSLRMGSLVSCGARLLVVGRLDFHRSLLVLFYGRPVVIENSLSHVSKSGEERQSEIDNNVPSLSLIVVRFHQKDVLQQFSLVYEENRAPATPTSVKFFPAVAIGSLVSPGDRVELHSFRDQEAEFEVSSEHSEESTSNVLFLVEAVLDRGLDASAEQYRVESVSFTKILVIHRVSEDGTVERGRALSIPHYFVRRVVGKQVQGVCSLSQIVSVIPASVPMQAQSSSRETFCKELTDPLLDGELSCASTPKAASLAELLQAPDCGRIVLVTSVSEEPLVLLRKRTAEFSSSKDSLSLLTVVVSVSEALLRMAYSQVGLIRGSPILVDDNDADPNSSSSDNLISPLVRRCSEEAQTFHPKVQHWARRLVLGDPNIMGICLCAFEIETTDSIISSLRSAMSLERILFSYASVEEANAVIELLRGA